MFIVSCQIIPITLLVADEPKPNLSLEPLDNIGFMKNPPRSLKEKFPMCDAFLNVEWIDKEKKIGYSNYEIILNKNKERKTMWSLVWLDALWPQATIDVYRYKKEGNLYKLFSFIRRGKLIPSSTNYLAIQDGKRKEYFESISTFDFSWSNNQQTVCIAYPDNKIAWIVEGKSVKNGLNESEKAIMTEKITKAVGYPLKDVWFNGHWLIDINYDGQLDLVRGQSVKYSSGSEYYENKIIEPRVGWGAWRFPPLNKECVINKEVDWNQYLTTDGKDYYFAHECNLTEVTTSNERE